MVLSVLGLVLDLFFKAFYLALTFDCCVHGLVASISNICLGPVTFALDHVFRILELSLAVAVLLS